MLPIPMSLLCKLVAIKMANEPQTETRSENKTEEDDGCENAKHLRESGRELGGICTPLDNMDKEVTPRQERRSFVGGHSGLCIALKL